jgi:hypothetical protein
MAADDTSIFSRIGELVDQEKQLRTQHQGTRLDEEERRSLAQIETELDQCWDLLNQRRALREFDMDPEQAKVRDADTVEGYQQ